MEEECGSLLLGVKFREDSHEKRAETGSWPSSQQPTMVKHTIRVDVVSYCAPLTADT